MSFARRTGLEPVSPALEAGIRTTGPTTCALPLARTSAIPIASCASAAGRTSARIRQVPVRTLADHLYSVAKTGWITRYPNRAGPVVSGSPII